MQKIILFSLVCFSSHLMAQKSFFGVDAGVNVANQRVAVSNSSGIVYSNTNPHFYQNVIKPTLGCFYQRDLLEKIAIRIGARYVSLGYKFHYNSDYDVTINYLTFPVTFNYHANKHLALTAGSYLSFTLNNTTVNNQVFAATPITSVYHKNDFGFTIGAEHDLYKNFALAVNYFIGTKNILLNDQGGSIKYTNRALQFTLIYKFRKSKGVK